MVHTVRGKDERGVNREVQVPVVIDRRPTQRFERNKSTLATIGQLRRIQVYTLPGALLRCKATLSH